MNSIFHRISVGKYEDRPVEKGDITIIDFAGSIDGVAFNGGTAENQELEIGSNKFIPGFEDQVIGMKIDEEKDIKEITLYENGEYATIFITSPGGVKQNYKTSIDISELVI